MSVSRRILMAGLITSRSINGYLIDIKEADLIEHGDGLTEKGFVVGGDEDAHILGMRLLVAGEPVTKLFYGDGFPIKENRVAVGDLQLENLGWVGIGGRIRIRQLHRHGREPVQREGEQDEGGQQEEDDVNERDDLNARFFSC